MAGMKRKERDDGNRGKNKSKKHANIRRKKTGPHLPSSLKKEIERLNPTTTVDDIDEVDSDVYEYEEEQPEEESRKNKRYDPVSVTDDLNSDFEDENVQSDDENEDDNDDYIGTKRNGNVVSDDFEEEDYGKHVRMLQGITGMPSEAFEENKKKTMMKDAIIPELYPESEYNPSRDVVDGDGLISIEDLLNPLRENPDYAKLRKREQQIKKNARTVYAPLPTADQLKIERKAAYEISKKDVTKWQPIIQRNREAPTIFFDEKVDLGFSTIGAIAFEFEPRTEFERKMDALVHDDRVMEAHKKDGSRLLEMNKVSLEDVKGRQNRMAKLRSYLFRHEMKAKHIKKIKSKTYHRLLKKDKLKALSSQIEMDPEAAKEYAIKQELQRAEERMTLKHKQNPWAKRIKIRGLHNQDDGTRAAIDELHRKHAELSRKQHSMKGSSSSSDDSADEYDEDSASSDQDRASKLLGKAKEKTMKVLEEEGGIPKSGLLSFPFMRRGLEKGKKAAIEEANLTLQEYEDSLKKLEDSGGSEDPEPAPTGGRRVFGMDKAQIFDASKKVKPDNFYNNSDSEDDLVQDTKRGSIENGGSDLLQKDVNSDFLLVQEDVDTHKESVFKNFDEIVKNPGAKTIYEVSIAASTRKKENNKNDKSTDIKKSQKRTGPVGQDIKGSEKDLGEDSDVDSEGQMVDGILTSASKPSYELPSQEELHRQVFAGDHVDDEFEKDKQEILNVEIPEPEKPVSLPGWGQWTHIQQKKGLPSWMVKKHEDAQKKREEALKKRKDAQLKNVIISEKLDKKAEKLHTKVLPFPFTSKEVFEQSMRVPIGPESNPATAIGLLNRPEVMKRSGVIIKPVEFEEVNPHENSQQRSGDKNKMKKNKGNDSKSIKKSKFKSKG